MTQSTIKQATTSYETWMRACGPTVVESDLRFKHKQMREDPYLFLRATYYRWAQLFPDLCPDLIRAPQVLGDGDLHVGSFGTWRDSEGRLCWGIDDFDECAPLPYTNDLVRLAASAKIVARSEQLTISLKDACDAILEGYQTSLKNGGTSFVLAEGQQHMEKLGIDAMKVPDDFWDKLSHLPVVPDGLPAAAAKALVKTLPDPQLKCKIARRRAGVGSLGQERFVALVQWKGAWIARELKALLPSASVWLAGATAQTQDCYQEAMSHAVRSPDAFQTISGGWLTRRLSPDSNPIDVTDLPKSRDESKLLFAMGAEAANVHLGRKRQTASIQADLRKRKADWLHSAARTMAKAVIADWKQYIG